VSGSGDASNLSSRNATSNGGSSALSSVTGLSLGTSGNGGDAGNYASVSTTGSSITIDKLALTGSITTGSSTYGSTLAPGAASFTNAVSGDDLGTATIVVNTTGKLSSSGNLKAGSYSGIESVSALSGADVANYTFNGVTGDYTVSAKALDASGLGVTAKIYDGGTGATVSGVAGLTAGGTNPGDGKYIGTDVVSLSGTASGTYDTKNAGTGKTVTISGLSLTGTDAGNYTLSAYSQQGDIGKGSATVTANSGELTYNGLTQSVSGFKASGLAAGETESVLVGVTAGGNGKNAGIYDTKAIGTDSNYDLNFIDGTLRIIPASLTIRAHDVSKNAGEEVILTGYSPTGLQNGETVGSVDLASDGAAKAALISGSPYVITASNASGGTFDRNNYDITYVNGVLSITQEVEVPVQTLLTSTTTIDNATGSGSGTTFISTSGGQNGNLVALNQSTETGGSNPIVNNDVEVSLLSPMTLTSPGLIKVSVPENVADSGAFDFRLPTEVAATLGNTTPVVTSADGKPLPSWLRYDNTTKTFTVTNDAPAGTEQINVVVKAGLREWRVEINMESTH